MLGHFVLGLIFLFDHVFSLGLYLRGLRFVKISVDIKLQMIGDGFVAIDVIATLHDAWLNL